MPLPPLVADLVDEATGRRVRGDAVRPPSGGPAGNAQLTAWTGALLLTRALAELVTLFDVGRAGGSPASHRGDPDDRGDPGRPPPRSSPG